MITLLVWCGWHPSRPNSFMVMVSFTHTIYQYHYLIIVLSTYAATVLHFISAQYFTLATYVVARFIATVWVGIV